MGDESKDLLGLRPLADTVHVLAKGAVDGAAAFLGRICNPAAEEFGLLLRDRISYWRLANAVSMARKAEAKYEERIGSAHAQVHPRLAAAVIENSSWTDVEQVQEMWAGLLVSSCTKDGRDEDNLIFVNLLSQLTTTEAKLLNHACTTAKKVLVLSSLISSEGLYCSARDLRALTGLADMDRIDRELDHLHTLGLIQGGFKASQSTLTIDEAIANIAPTALALNMFVRCHGARQTPAHFFGLSQIPAES